MELLPALTTYTEPNPMPLTLHNTQQLTLIPNTAGTLYLSHSLHMAFDVQAHHEDVRLESNGLANLYINWRSMLHLPHIDSLLFRSVVAVEINNKLLWGELRDKRHSEQWLAASNDKQYKMVNECCSWSWGHQKDTMNFICRSSTYISQTDIGCFTRWCGTIAKQPLHIDSLLYY